MNQSELKDVEVIETFESAQKNDLLCDGFKVSQASTDT